MAVICPTITAYDPHEFRAQIERVAPFAKRIHIDLMDGQFVETTSPSLEQIWWPRHVKADLHLMYQRPMEHIDQLIKLRPRLVIVHNEADLHHMHFAAELHRADIKTGLALLADTPVDYAEQIMHSFDHVLVFSGHLGYHGGNADLGLLAKVGAIKAHHPEVEVGWDGGINAHNAKDLITGGVDVLNVGGFIQKADDPAENYRLLVRIAG